MKITFFTSQKQNWGEKQAEISKTLCDFLAKGKDFSVKFDFDKTGKQHRGYWRLIDLVTPYLKKAYGDEIKTSNDAHEFIKMESGFCKKVKTKKSELVLPKSLTEATLEDMKVLIENLYFVCEFFKIKDYELKSEEEREMNEWFNQ